MKTSACAALLGGSLILAGAPAFAPEASAQESPPAGGARIEHIDPTGGYRGFGPAPEGVKRVTPGALLLASLDKNFDGKVSRSEITACAPSVFAAADANKDGKISGFEQTDWANSVGGQGEILSNSMMFDANLDRSITPDEFSKGLLRLADEVMGRSVDEIAFTDLMKPLTRPEPQDASDAPVVVARPTGAGNQASPTVVGN